MPDSEVSRPLRVFLCHSSADKRDVRILYRRLRADGIDVWLDEENLLPGQDWDREIRKAVKTSDIVIVCLSQGAITKAGYLHKEIRVALDVADEQPEDSIFLIPLKLGECDVPDRLSRWQWVNLFEKNGYERLMRALSFRSESLQANVRAPIKIIPSGEMHQDKEDDSQHSGSINIRTNQLNIGQDGVGYDKSEVSSRNIVHAEFGSTKTHREGSASRLDSRPLQPRSGKEQIKPNGAEVKRIAQQESAQGKTLTKSSVRRVKPQRYPRIDAHPQLVLRELLRKISVSGWVLISIVIIVLFATLSVGSILVTKIEVESHISVARNQITLATQAVTGKETRDHYAAAAAKAKEALGLEPQNQEAQQILAQAQAELDKIDNVITLAQTRLWDFKISGQRHLASTTFSLFVLDRMANQVNRLILNSVGDKLEGNPDPILVPGVTVNGQALGDLVDFTSLASTTNRQVDDLVIGHEKGLIEYNLSFGMQAVPFGSNTLASSVKRLRSFDGKLYALDPGKQQIMKYEPQGDGYPTTPTPYFAQALPDLAQATDMAIDGNIYVALSNGRLLKFKEGQPESFEIRNLGEPLQKPTIVAIDQNVLDSSVYVVDAALKRIVQFRPDGLSVRQFRAEAGAFDDIQDIVVDEQNNRLYVVGKEIVYTLMLPRLTDTVMTSTPTPTRVPIPTSTRAALGEFFVTIREIKSPGNLANEQVILTNLSGQVNMAGWTMTDGEGNKFTFPSLSLLSNGEVTVHTGWGTNTPTDLYWGQTESRWASGKVAYLRDPSGKLIATYQVP